MARASECPDEQLDGVASAILRLVASSASPGQGDPSAARDAAALLVASIARALTPHAARASRAGRKPVHDREWASSALMDIALQDPDGLPLSQAAMVARLRDRFEADGRAVPGDTWLKAEVSAFYKAAGAFEADAIRRYRSSEALRSVFKTEAQFLGFRRARGRTEELWRLSPDLQRRHACFDDYLRALMTQAEDTAQDSET